MTAAISRIEIARVCHQVNKAYCVALGDMSQPDWDEAPDWQRESALTAVNFVIDNPDAGPSAQHDQWMADKIAAGWVYGEKKDDKADPKTHPDLIPYEKLKVETRAKDSIFQAIVRSLI